MEQVVRDFLKSHEVGCVAVEISDGIHAAAVHYTLTEKGTFYIRTDINSRKCSLIKDNGEVNAALVVGFSTDEWKTYQADGRLRLIIDPAERQNFGDVREKQFPGKNFVDDLEVAFLEFVPMWSRYTDSNTKPKTIIEE